jgi:hypothetical protein
MAKHLARGGPGGPSPGSRGGSADAAAKAARLQHHERKFLDALALIVASGRAGTVEDLIRYAEQAGQTQAAAYLQTLADEALPVDLAYDALHVHLRIVAHKRNSLLLRACQGKRVGLVVPLPPHVLDAFMSTADARLLVPDGAHLPPHLRDRVPEAVQGSRASRRAAADLEAVVFEAYHSQGSWYIDAGTSDVVDLRILPAEARLVAHVRPHRHPGDVPLELGTRAVEVL